MRKLDKITSEVSQKFTLATDDGQQIKLALRYLPAIQQWTYSITSNSKIINGKRLVCSPNILRAHQNILTFGLAVTSTDILDPMYIDDFISERINVYLLNISDLAKIESYFYQ